MNGASSDERAPLGAFFDEVFDKTGLGNQLISARDELVRRLPDVPEEELDDDFAAWVVENIGPKLKAILRGKS